MSDSQSKIDALKSAVKEYPDFPKQGVLFRDIFGIFKDPVATKILQEVLIEKIKNITPPVECIAALDSRGFLLGPLIALALQIPFVPIRKKGKLPGQILTESYNLEYGHDSLQIQTDSIKLGVRTLIVDDLLATGGSLEAACKLVKRAGGSVVGCLVLMELTELGGRAKLSTEVHTILEY